MLISPDRLRFAMKSKGINQSELARHSGVSRVQLNRLLSKARGGVGEKKVGGLEIGVSVTPEDLALGGKIRLYCGRMSEGYAHLDFRGFGMPEFKPQPISAVFIDPEVVEVIDGKRA